MRAMVVALFLALGLNVTSANAQSDANVGEMTTAQLVAAAPTLHPAALYVLAARFMNEGEGIEAANWMYAGQLRYRFLLVARNAQPSDDDMILFSALSESVGRPVNEYIGGNVDEWIAAINWALEWDAEHDNPLTSKTASSDALATVRNGLLEFRDSLEERREEIPRLRAENGLPNR